jgi:hypothetical protein
MQRDGPVLNMVLRIFLRVIEQTKQAHCPGADHSDKANLHIGAVAFIHQFGFIRGLQHFTKPPIVRPNPTVRVRGWNQAGKVGGGGTVGSADCP